MLQTKFSIILPNYKFLVVLDMLWNGLIWTWSCLVIVAVVLGHNGYGSLGERRLGFAWKRQGKMEVLEILEQQVKMRCIKQLASM